MHIELIEIEGDALVQARVGDDLYSGARVPVSDLPQAERRWLSSLASKVLALFPEHGERISRSDGKLVVSKRTASGWEEVSDETSLENGAYTQLYVALGKFLDAVQGCLLIDERSTGLQRKARGDSPA